MEVMVVVTIIRKVIVRVTIRMGAKAETIGKLLDSFLKYLAVIGTLFYCVNYVGVDSKTLLASAGLLTLIVGLGAQSLISDILAGIFIVFEGEFRVGDIIMVDTFRGTVLEIGVRSTKIENADCDIKIVNNSKITGVLNMTKKLSYAYCDVGIEYNQSLEHVESILHKALPEIKLKHSEIEEGPFYKGVISLADSSVVIRIIALCEEHNKIQLNRDLNREIKLLFDKNNINIPFPQVVMHEAPKNEKKARTTKKDRDSAEKFVKEQKESSKEYFVEDDD